MTPGEHAATVRHGMLDHATEAHAALDALQAQAEEAEHALGAHRLMVKDERRWRAEAEAQLSSLRRQMEEQREAGNWPLADVVAERDRLAARVGELEAALQQIAEPMPTSHRRQIDQLTDAVRWRQGIARDALARVALAGETVDR